VAKSAGERLLKAAELAYPGYNMGMVHQRFAPIVKRRDDLTQEEREEIEKGKRQWWPRIFRSKMDSPAVDMASPGKAALLSALWGAAVGGGTGAVLSQPMKPHAGVRDLIGNADAKATMLGALLGAGVLGTIGYYGRKAKNRDIEESMRRIPANGTRRDIESDPVYQEERTRAINARAYQNAYQPIWLQRHQD